MSKYSLQLRWLVEQTLADAKLPNIEANWHAAYDKLGLADYPIFDETYRETLNNKIIRHYWAYEIGSETSGLFRWNLRDAMFMIMPYYNQMYLSEITAKGIQPLIDHTRTITEDATGTASNNANTSATSTSNAQDIFSDTPMSSRPATTRPPQTSPTLPRPIPASRIRAEAMTTSSRARRRDMTKPNPNCS